MHPHLKFKIDYQKDIQTFFDFNQSAHYDSGRTLDWAFFKKYPSLKKYKDGYTLKISKKEIGNFVKNIYEKETETMKENLLKYESIWRKKEKDFYNLTDELFGKSFWPKGKYIAYPTIWGMFPRFLEDMTFQLPYKYKDKKYINVIIAHEMLHFIFYNYFYKKCPKYKKDDYDFFVWNVSEIFNVLVQNSSKWLEVFKVKTMQYPEHRKIINNFKKNILPITLTNKNRIQDLLLKILSSK